MRTFLHSSKNEYVRTEDGVWVRNPCKSAVVPLNINDLGSTADKRLFLENEVANLRKGRVYLPPSLRAEKVVVVSDGFDFEGARETLKRLVGKGVRTLAVNGAVAAMPDEERKLVDRFVVNNPYRQCLKDLPKEGRCPSCIASVRTCPEFVSRYRGEMTFYSPTNEENFASTRAKHDCSLDDYRSPVCAALSLAYRMGASRVLLLCCDESYERERPGTVRLDNGLWSYPQQLAAQRVLDLTCRWLGLGGVRVGNCSSGMKYSNAEYIGREDAPKFLHDEQ